jgi:hypothetical protein
MLAIASCSKNESEPPARTKPMLGTTWTYFYKKYDAVGVFSKGFRIIYRISSEQTVNNEKWFVVTDSTQSPVFILSQKADGLYHVVNNAPYLLCKYPATVNESYNS